MSVRACDLPRIEPGDQSAKTPVLLTCPVPSGPNYMVWLLVIVLGTAGGNLLATWITARVVEYRLQAAAQEAARALSTISDNAARANREALQRSEASRIAQQERLRQTRAVDPVGIKLSRQCEDWKRMEAQLPSPTAKLEAEKSCRGYQHYLDTGQPGAN